MTPTEPHLTPLRRHALVWLSRAPRAESPGDADAVGCWHADGHPFVVCRRRGGGDRVSLGFCVEVPGRRPRRIAASAAPCETVRVARPPALEDVAAVGPDSFARLSAAAARAGIDVRVFGSWMWQAIAGGSYAGGSSDLDVLVDVADAAAAGKAAGFLRDASAGCPFEVDGELSLPGLGEVHWREYLGREPSLLVKSLDSVRIVRREELWK